MLRKYPYFKIQAHIINGRDLLAMDRGGVSDPYIKCIHGQDKLFQTKPVAKTVNPMWDETFAVHIDNPFKPITFQVFDKDMVGADDFMGEATIELTELNLTKLVDFSFKLFIGLQKYAHQFQSILWGYERHLLFSIFSIA